MSSLGGGEQVAGEHHLLQRAGVDPADGLGDHGLPLGAAQRAVGEGDADGGVGSRRRRRARGRRGSCRADRGHPGGVRRAGRRRPRGRPARLSPGSSANAKEPKQTRPGAGQVAPRRGPRALRACSQPPGCWASANRSAVPRYDGPRPRPSRPAPRRGAPTRRRRGRRGAGPAADPVSSMTHGAHDQRRRLATRVRRVAGAGGLCHGGPAYGSRSAAAVPRGSGTSTDVAA